MYGGFARPRAHPGVALRHSQSEPVGRPGQKRNACSIGQGTVCDSKTSPHTVFHQGKRKSASMSEWVACGSVSADEVLRPPDAPDAFCARAHRAIRQRADHSPSRTRVGELAFCGAFTLRAGGRTWHPKPPV